MAVAATGCVGSKSHGDCATFKFPPPSRHDPGLGTLRVAAVDAAGQELLPACDSILQLPKILRFDLSTGRARFPSAPALNADAVS